jgi:hypothetical protein
MLSLNFHEFSPPHLGIVQSVHTAVTFPKAPLTLFNMEPVFSTLEHIPTEQITQFREGTL